MNVNPWKRIWLIGFTEGKRHWFLRLFYRARPGFAHCWLLSPLGNGEDWLFADWSAQGACVTFMNARQAERLFCSISDDGGILRYENKDFPKRSIARIVTPTTCASVAREFLALPPRWAFWRASSPALLWCELRRKGAEVVVMPKNEPRW